MGYEVIIYGDLTLDSRAVSAWKKTRLETATVETLVPRLPNNAVEFVRLLETHAKNLAKPLFEAPRGGLIARKTKPKKTRLLLRSMLGPRGVSVVQSSG